MSGASRACWSGGYPQVWAAGVQAYLEAKRKAGRNFDLLEYAKSLGYQVPSEEPSQEPAEQAAEENFDLGSEPPEEVIVPESAEPAKAKAKGLFKPKE